MNREIKLAPSILAADFMKLSEQIGECEKNGAAYLHYDVMDGLFVPSLSFGLPVIASIRKGTGIFIDCHLMIVEPYRYIEEFVKAGADSVTIHYEACKEHGCTESLKKIKECGARRGISIRPGTPIVHILPYLGMVDMVLLMSVEPGFGGQPFIPSTYDKLRELTALREEGGFDFDIEVDGGITLDNVSDVIDAGANVIVSGSSVFKGDIAGNVSRFIEIFKGKQ
ncbi:MAG: ribulose-phosphate 3-epimerase [Lachnospiraceae bacterium]|nr:ribulose-phosphate 3-epimerase [Lachnospiraceae bacterium]MCR5769572.1 ribulose-phosphate 3-epimerase [Lachnospiraceae bacterium]